MNAVSNAGPSLESPLSDYSLSWTCGDCKTQNERSLTKFEAAFCEALKIHRKLCCKKCGGGSSTSMAYPIPDLADPEIMQAWLGDKKLFFMQQDEELALAGIDARRLVELLRNPATPRWRGGTLLLALMEKVCAGIAAEPEEERVAKDYLRQTLDDWKDAKSIRFQIRKAVIRSLADG